MLLRLIFALVFTVSTSIVLSGTPGQLYARGGDNAGIADSIPKVVLPNSPDRPDTLFFAQPDSMFIAEPDTVIKPDPLPPVFRDVRLEVNITARELYVYSGSERVASYPVAVGKRDWPTKTGNWDIYAVVWNPWWHPPDQEWAWGRAIMAPGDPDNPLGRAQLVYDAPRSIHGTNEPSSIGRAVSHGSIRVDNEVAMNLAKIVMEATGVGRNDDWYDSIRTDRFRNILVDIREPVPIRVYK